MKPLRLGVIGLGQRIAHVLKACAEMGWRFRDRGLCRSAPVGLPILQEADIAPGRSYKTIDALLRRRPFRSRARSARPIICITSICWRPSQRAFPSSARSRSCARRTKHSRWRGISPPRKRRRSISASSCAPCRIVREVIARVDSGALGELVSLDTTEHLPPEHGGYLARNWRRKQAWGGSFMLDKVCHDFDIFGRLVGARRRARRKLRRTTHLSCRAQQCRPRLFRRRTGLCVA